MSDRKRSNTKLRCDEFRASSFPSTSKSGVCWDPLQTLVVQGEPSESLYYRAETATNLRVPQHLAEGTEHSRFYPIPDSRHIGIGTQDENRWSLAA